MPRALPAAVLALLAAAAPSPAEAKSPDEHFERELREGWRGVGEAPELAPVQGFPADCRGNRCIVPGQLERLFQEGAGDKPGWTNRANFHVHSTCSDGMRGPEEVVALLHAQGVRVMALTDHDNVSCVPRARAAAKKLGMEFYAGVEISAGPGVHILGLGVDPDHPGLAALLEANQSRRRLIASELVERLNRLPELRSRGITITMAEVAAVAGGSIGRPHVAQVLVAKGLVRDKDQAFYTLFRRAGRLRPLPPEQDEAEEEDEEDEGSRDATPQETLAAVKAAGGISFLAHPYTVEGGQERVREILAMGVAGLEGYRPVHARTPQGIERRDARLKKYLLWADELKLLVLGGSDYHGEDSRLSVPAVSVPGNLAAQAWRAIDGAPAASPPRSP